MQICETMKLFIRKSFFYAAFLFAHFTLAQAPWVKQWDYRFGATEMETIKAFERTSDGGYILGGISNSDSSGDKTQFNRDTSGFYNDYWIIKIDSSGNKQWDKTFGGTGNDLLSSLKQTSDGGYILGGYSASGISGDKTQLAWGFFDYWIVKIDSLGNKQWDKDFGGTQTEHLYSILQTTDGGYLLGGYSRSGINGNKTQANWGLFDYWIVKTDSLGNKEWDKDFGGNNNDDLFALLQTSDGGYLLGGSSLSGISGDKSQATVGLMDFWIIKIDSSGNKLWDKAFGGTDTDILHTIQSIQGGFYFLGGISLSNAGGDKSQNSWGNYDFWLIKIDASGNKIWDKDFGGTGSEDEFSNILALDDGGYILGGCSYSGIGGNKSENNLGTEQSWLLKTDSAGNVLWDKTMMTPGHDEEGFIVQAIDGCFTLANFSDGGSGGYKTQPSWGIYDFWVIKFCDSTFGANFISSQFLCPGSCINFINLSTNSQSYQWLFSGASPGTSSDVNPTNICYPSPGSYDVQLIATNANGSDTLLLSSYITVYPSPPPQSITQSGDTLFAIAGATSYQWYFNTNLINGATDYFYVALSTGDYNVVATDVNGCEVEAVIFNVIANTLLTVDRAPLTIFPNPVGDKITIQKSQVTRTVIEISIYNVLGEKMEIEIPASALRQQSTEINVQSLSPGLYYIEITSFGKTFRSKFVKR